MSDLTLSSNAPLEPVPFISLVAQHQTIAHEVTAAVGRVLAEQKFILGEEVSSFETEIAQYCDSRSAIGCASGTDALILALPNIVLTPHSAYYSDRSRGEVRRRGIEHAIAVLRGERPYYIANPAVLDVLDMLGARGRAEVMDGQ